LRSLPRVWDPKVIAITKVKDLYTLSFDDLLGSLMTHEIMLKRDKGEDSKKMKNAAFKVEKEEKGSRDSDDDDIAFLARKFNRFLKKKDLTKERISKRINNKSMMILMIFDVLSVKS